MTEKNNKIIKYLKDEIVLTVAWILAIISMFLVSPDKEYISYIHWDTICMLLSLMVVMAGFKKEGVFNYLGAKLLGKTKSRHTIELVLVMATFFSSMLITNDVALITFVPFSLITLRMGHMEDRIIPVVALQSIAANLGAMLTPIGNPHNIYFYFLSEDYTTLNFMRITAPFVLLGGVMLIVFVFLQKNKELEKGDELTAPFTGDRKAVKTYVLLFILALTSLFKTMVPLIALVVVVSAFGRDKEIFKHVDYSLLFTFIGFFIFIGNMQRVESFANFVSNLVEDNAMLVTVGLSQIISNLPTAILLSGFTDNFNLLIVGTDIGGLGTLIASMANLISYKWIIKEAPDLKKSYVPTFTIYCIIFLVFELALCYFTGLW